MVRKHRPFNIVNKGPKPKHLKQLALNESYQATLYNRYAAKLGKGSEVHVQVRHTDKGSIALVTIGHILLSQKADLNRKYTVEVELKDGSVFIEGKMIECKNMGQLNYDLATGESIDHKDVPQVYRVRIISTQPPRSWMNKT